MKKTKNFAHLKITCYLLKPMIPFIIQIIKPTFPNVSHMLSPFNKKHEIDLSFFKFILIYRNEINRPIARRQLKHQHLILP